jgi:hypothetical protein
VSSSSFCFSSAIRDLKYYCRVESIRVSISESRRSEHVSSGEEVQTRAGRWLIKKTEKEG